MPENVLMGIRRGLALALVLSISCPCELSHEALGFWALEHGSGQGATSNLRVERSQLRRPIWVVGGGGGHICLGIFFF